MYVVYYGGTGSMGAELARGPSIAVAQMRAVAKYNEDAEELQVSNWNAMVAVLAQVEQYVLVVRT